MFLYKVLTNPNFAQVRRCHFNKPSKPRHLICFKQWTPQMVLDIVNSAMNLKHTIRDTHKKRLDILANAKVMILQEINQPVLNLAVSKAATLLGAYDVPIIDNVVWEHDYNGRIFSYMTDAIFVSTTTHMCVQRFANQSNVPVMCMLSRTHASVQSLATVMAIYEQFGTMKNVNITYYGPTHPVLNSYLLLAPMLGANIKFKCCCDKCPVSPLLFKASEDMSTSQHTKSVQCVSKEDALYNTNVVIAGPTTLKKEKIKHFKITEEDIKSYIRCPWIFFHTCPRGEEVDDQLFYHSNARTFDSFENMQFIVAALLASAIRDYRF